jgi:hypothetical protein
MITHIDGGLNGLVAHWSVSDAAVVRTLSHQYAGYELAQITTYDVGGNVIDDHLFPVGDRVFIELPSGQWLYEASPDGMTWHNVLGNQEINGLPPMLTGGPGVHVQVFVDGEPGALEVWGRCTLQGVPAPAPAPVITTAAVKQLTTNVAALQTNVATINAILKRNRLK